MSSILTFPSISKIVLLSAATQSKSRPAPLSFSAAVLIRQGARLERRKIYKTTARAMPAAARRMKKMCARSQQQLRVESSF
jgi:hypothetical protein